MKIPKPARRWDLTTPFLIFLGVFGFVMVSLILAPTSDLFKTIFLNSLWLALALFYFLKSHFDDLKTSLEKLSASEEISSPTELTQAYKRLLKRTLFKSRVRREMFVSYFRMGNYEAAKLVLRKIRIRKRDFELNYLRGQIFQVEGDYPKALEIYESILARRKFLDVLRACALCYVQIEDFINAEKSLLELISYENYNPWNYYYLAHFYLKTRNWALALQMFSQFLEFEGQLPDSKPFEEAKYHVDQLTLYFQAAGAKAKTEDPGED